MMPCCFWTPTLRKSNISKKNNLMICLIILVVKINKFNLYIKKHILHKTMLKCPKKIYLFLCTAILRPMFLIWIWTHLKHMKKLIICKMRKILQIFHFLITTEFFIFIIYSYLKKNSYWLFL
jgi:hypothetical protein